MIDAVSGLIEGDWDVVIVGAGTAGCVLANRLSTDRRYRVLLIEARHPWSSDNPAEGFHHFPGSSVTICPIRPSSRGEIHLLTPGAARTTGDHSELPLNRRRPQNDSGRGAVCSGDLPTRTTGE